MTPEQLLPAVCAAVRPAAVACAPMRPPAPFRAPAWRGCAAAAASAPRRPRRCRPPARNRGKTAQDTQRSANGGYNARRGSRYLLLLAPCGIGSSRRQARASPAGDRSQVERRHEHGPRRHDRVQRGRAQRVRLQSARPEPLGVRAERFGTRAQRPPRRQQRVRLCALVRREQLPLLPERSSSVPRISKQAQNHVKAANRREKATAPTSYSCPLRLRPARSCWPASP